MSNSIAIQLQTHPAAKVRLGDGSFTLGHLLAGLYNGPTYHVTNVDGRGLYWTDKRYTANGGCAFIGWVPTWTPFDIIRNYEAAVKAVKGRNKAAKPLTAKEYQLSLIVRSIRGQILNPILRKDGWLSINKIAERLRQVALGKQSRFMKMALNPINLNYLISWVVRG